MAPWGSIIESYQNNFDVEPFNIWNGENLYNVLFESMKWSNVNYLKSQFNDAKEQLLEY